MCVGETVITSLGGIVGGTLEVDVGMCVGEAVITLLGVIVGGVVNLVVADPVGLEDL